MKIFYMQASETASPQPPARESLPIRLAESGRVPDPVIRAGIRRLIRKRLRSLDRARSEAFIAGLRAAPIALQTARANAQHYELPPAFFEHVLGPNLKYSCAWFDSADTPLAEAEALMLELCCARAGLEDGMRVLDLGAGWGALSLWLARRYPHARVLAVSNSKLQRDFISARARERAVDNLEVVTADANWFAPAGRFDRIVSVEMLEHARNWPLLLRRMADWLAPGGAAFVHVFCHRELAYPFETEAADDWMGRHFFSGGMMPSLDLLGRFDDALQVAERWSVDGRHYQRTALAWLQNLDARTHEIRAILAQVHGEAAARIQLQRWRLFFMAVAQLFGFAQGREWGVGHYRLVPARSRA
jgi:cyclopropane-fatty-acyl-phospholipid synthase